MPVRVRTRVRRNAKASTAVSPGLKDAQMQAAGAGFEVAMDRVPYGATGDLQRGLHEPEYDDATGRVWWGSSAPHTLPVEYGSRPHWPPIDPLKRWARVVLGDESAAYAVQQAIAQNGTPPQPFIRPGVDRMRAVLRGTGITTFIERHIP